MIVSQQKAKKDKHISLARELGYEGQELRAYIKKQQDLEREEMVAQREYERETREAERLRLWAEQKNKDREAAQRAKELELEKIKYEANKLKLEAEQRDKDREATQRIKDKEMKMEKLKFEA